MDFAALILYGFYFAILAVFIVGLVMGAGVALSLAGFAEKRAAVWLPVLLLAGFALARAVSRDNVSLYGLAGAASYEPAASALGTWILRLATLSSVLIGATVVTGAILRRKQVGGNPSWPLFAGFFLYYLCAHVANALFAPHSQLTYKILYPPLIIAAIYYAARFDVRSQIRLLQYACLGFLLLSFLFLVIRPETVLQRNYRGLFPFSFRFWGLASHANNLGPLSLFFLILLVWLPLQRRWMTIAAGLVGALALLLSQSKTSILIGAGIAVVLVCRWLIQQLFSARKPSALAVLALLVGISAVMVLFIATVLGERHIMSGYDRLFGPHFKLEHLLTGRSRVWDITMQHWGDSRIFGYGTELWSPEFAARYGYLGVASNAHNQFIDTLGSSGIVGFTGLIIYLTILAIFSVRLLRVSNGASLALLLLILLRGYTEVPLKTVNVTTSDFFMHCAILALFGRAYFDLQRKPATAAARAPWRSNLLQPSGEPWKTTPQA